MRKNFLMTLALLCAVAQGFVFTACSSDDDDEYVKGIGTGIMEVKNGSVNTEKWYSIDGRMLNGKPAQKGIYIINGKKVMK